MHDLLDKGNTCRSVWADSAYRSEALDADLKARGYRARAEVRIGFMILTYNMTRFCILRMIAVF